MPAIPTGVTSLRTGAVSVVFHVPFESAERAFDVHAMQGKNVRLDIYLEED